MLVDRALRQCSQAELNLIEFTLYEIFSQILTPTYCQVRIYKQLCCLRFMTMEDCARMIDTALISVRDLNICFC